MQSRCIEVQEERNDASLSETLRYLIGLGLDARANICAASPVEKKVDTRISELERSIRKENDAALEKAVAKLDKAVGKVSSIQKQTINAAGASNGSLIAIISFMACYLADHPEGHEQWAPLMFDERWRFFFGTGRQLAFEKDAMRNFYHAFSGAPERTGNEFASLADIYCEGDEAYAENLMSRSDKEGLDYLARTSAKEKGQR